MPPRLQLVAGFVFALCGALAGRAEDRPASPDPRFVVGDVVTEEDFSVGLEQWTVEAQKPGVVRVANHTMEIDMPAGCTVWLNRLLSGPVLISFEAVAVKAGGPNDRVSDLNCFWMARDARSPADLFATVRGGAFAEYDHLRCYYVGLGGNSNTSSRFRRYVGVPGNRPLLPEHDLSAPEFLLQANAWQSIQLLAAGSTIAYYRDGRRLFSLEDPRPYTSGWFGFRTVTSHLRFRHFSVHRLVPAGAGLKSGG